MEFFHQIVGKLEFLNSAYFHILQQICVSWNQVNNKHEKLFSVSLESEQKQGRE